MALPGLRRIERRFGRLAADDRDDVQQELLTAFPDHRAGHRRPGPAARRAGCCGLPTEPATPGHTGTAPGPPT
ncbi:hypothetical protein ACU686_09990 [Yinghuangia aomiensis]